MHLHILLGAFPPSHSWLCGEARDHALAKGSLAGESFQLPHWAGQPALTPAATGTGSTTLLQGGLLCSTPMPWWR